MTEDSSLRSATGPGLQQLDQPIPGSVLESVSGPVRQRLKSLLLRSHLNLILLSLFIAPWMNLAAASMAVDEIMERAYTVKRVDDHISTLSFTFSNAEKRDQHIVYTMVWKNTHGEDGYDNKTMFFVEEPVDRRGIAYLGWLVPAGSEQVDNEWIYLPELRTARRIPRRNRDRDRDDDEFSRSLLKRVHLEPRPPLLDTHTLVAEERYDDRLHFLVASTPRRPGSKKLSVSSSGDAVKTISWIDQSTYHIDRAQYFDISDNLVLDVKFYWTQIDGYSMWSKVIATNPVEMSKTVMEITNIKVNRDLGDRQFSKRLLKRGSSGFIR